jgi:hypothetical protein
MSQGKKISYVQQGKVEKYGRVPPKAPVVIVKRESSTKAANQPKRSGTTGTNKTGKD